MIRLAAKRRIGVVLTLFDYSFCVDSIHQAQGAVDKITSNTISLQTKEPGSVAPLAGLDFSRSQVQNEQLGRRIGTLYAQTWQKQNARAFSAAHMEAMVSDDGL